ncbi:MAG TPA: EAL domain-containing protein [Devosiaceae bacterium]
MAPGIYGAEHAAATASILDIALQSMPYGFCVFDTKYRLLHWNARYLSIYGLDQASLSDGIGLLDLLRLCVQSGSFPGRSAEEVAAMYQDLLRGGGHEGSFVYRSDVRGRVIETRQSAAPGIGWVVTHEDVTDEVLAQQASKAHEAELALRSMQLDAAVNNMQQGLCMFDAERRLVICNETYASLYDMPRHLTCPGVRLEEILEFRLAHGLDPVGGPELYRESVLELVRENAEAKRIIEFEDGRVIAIQHCPMPDGGWVGTHQDITEQRRNEERIHYAARHDALTDLPNRIEFREAMATAEEAIARGAQMAVLCVDLDQFKAVNDTLGHAAGDALLVGVAERLSEAAGDKDLVARLGGDEFALLVDATGGLHEVAVLADRIVACIAQPFEVAGHQILIGASVGIAMAPVDGADAGTLLKCADLALYRAKNEGRGAYRFFKRGMDDALKRRWSIETGLKLAMVRDELSLVYQPLISVEDNRISCMEALLRWKHPELGMVRPDEFIPIAEETGLIVSIGEWVIQQACRTAAAWPEDVRVAVNLSAVQFRGRDLVEKVADALSRSGLRPERLELEITESLLLADNDAVLKTLHALRDLGVRISMDDFGTGYSSLSYLRSFPFDKIKIDRTFIADIVCREDDLEIIKAVIGLGQSLGMSTTAEGIETEAQLEAVRQQGCTEVQGFLFGPPLPASGIAELLGCTSPARPQRSAAQAN